MLEPLPQRCFVASGRQYELVMVVIPSGTDKGVEFSRGTPWLAAARDFHDLYVRARGLCHLWSSELIELADDSSDDYIKTEDGRRVFNGENVQRSKLRYEARRWVCSKLIRAYSDTNIEVTGKDGGPVKVETDVDHLELARWICYKLALGAEAKKRLEAKGDATDIEPSP